MTLKITIQDPLTLSGPTLLTRHLNHSFASDINHSKGDPLVRKHRLHVVAISIVEREQSGVVRSEPEPEPGFGSGSDGSTAKSVADPGWASYLYSYFPLANPLAAAPSQTEVYLRVEVYDSQMNRSVFFKFERRHVGRLGSLENLIQQTEFRSFSTPQAAKDYMTPYDGTLAPSEWVSTTIDLGFTQAKAEAGDGRQPLSHHHSAPTLTLESLTTILSTISLNPMYLSMIDDQVQPFWFCMVAVHAVREMLTSISTSTGTITVSEPDPSSESGSESYRIIGHAHGLDDPCSTRTKAKVHVCTHFGFRKYAPRWGDVSNAWLVKVILARLIPEIKEEQRKLDDLIELFAEVWRYKKLDEETKRDQGTRCA